MRSAIGAKRTFEIGRDGAGSRRINSSWLDRHYEAPLVIGSLITDSFRFPTKYDSSRPIALLLWILRSIGNLLTFGRLSQVFPQLLH